MPLIQRIINLPFFMAGFMIKTLFFMKKGYGRLYVKGLKKGIDLSRSAKGCEKKVKFQWKHLKNYLVIQVELWGNIFRRFVSGK